MAVKIKKQRYSHLHRDETTSWLLGNAGDTQFVVLDLVIGTDDEFTESNKMEFVFPDRVRKSSGTPWRENGFDVGDTVFVEYRWLNLGVDLGVFTIAEWVVLEINDLEMTLDTGSFPMPISYNELPYEEGQGEDGFRFMNAKMYAYKTPQAIEILYNHFENENTDSFPMNSVIDGNETKLLAEQTHLMTEGDWFDLTKLGYQSGMSIFNATIKRLSESIGDVNDNYGESEMSSPPGGQNLLRTRYHNLFNSWENNQAWSLPFTLTNAFDSSVHGQEGRFVGMEFAFDPGLVDYGLTHFGDQMFIHESLTTYTTSLNIDFVFKIDTVLNPVGSSKINLSIFEFVTIGTIGMNVPMTLVTKKNIKEWINPQLLTGQTLGFNSVFDLDVVTDRSYSLVLELESSANNGLAQNRVYYTVIKNDMSLDVPIGSGNPNTIGLLPYENAYQLRIDYMISGLFSDVSSFDLPLTPPDYLVAEKSLTDNFVIKAFPEYNNPNVVMKSFPEKTKQLGNVGWFNENFNGLPNDFNVESVDYFDLSGNQLDQLDYTIPVKVIMTISGIQNLGAEEDVAFGFAWVPSDETDYKNNERGFHENTFVSKGGEYSYFHLDTNYIDPVEGSGYDGIHIGTEDILFHVVSDELIAEITFRPSSEFTTFFENLNVEERNYILWISVADSTLETNLSNRVSLLVDFNQLEKTIPPLGEYSNIENKFIEHPEDENFDGVDEYEGFLEDDVLCRLPFRIDISEPIELLRMTFGVQVRNTTTGDVFELQKYPVDLTQFLTDSAGIHQINFDSIRGFKMENGDNKNWVKILRDDFGDVGSSKSYVAYFGMKIRWEDWLSRADVPVEFFDNTELNEGFNNDWLHYLRTSGHEIDFVVLIDANVDGTIGQYKNTFKFNFNDYDENELVSTEYKYFRASDDFEITQPDVDGVQQGIILNNEFTKIQIDYTRTDASKWILNEHYAVTTIGIVNGAGQFEHRQLSSVVGSEGDNPLIPVPGETKLLLSLVNNDETLRTVCLVDPGKLEESSRYKITGRVGCHDSAVSPPVGLYENLYENIYE